MRNIKFVKQPGLVADLFFLFTLHFNKEYFLKHGINYNKSTEDTLYYNSILKDFPPISDSLILFFYLGKNQQCFMKKYYFEPYRNKFYTDEYNTSVVQEAISDYEQVMENVINFYFKDADDETISECKSSISVVNKLIMESDYIPEIKNALYAFFIDPQLIIRKLSYEIIEKEFLLNQIYANNATLLAQLQLNFDFDFLCENLDNIEQQNVNLVSFKNINISFCFYNKNIIKLYYRNEVFIILGINYIESLEFLATQALTPELDVFGNAISEPNRVSVLDLILERGEITIKDLEQKFGFTGTNAYYHLSLMIKAGMLKTRNRGRTVLYSINKKYFEVLCDLFGKYYKS